MNNGESIHGLPIQIGSSTSGCGALGVRGYGNRCYSRNSTKEAPMASTDQSFRAFEQAGWEDPGVVAKYHGHLSDLTNQSIDVLLEAAAIRTGSRILDVAT